MTTLRKTFADGRVAEILPLLFGRARIGIGQADTVLHGYDDVW